MSTFRRMFFRPFLLLRQNLLPRTVFVIVLFGFYSSIAVCGIAPASVEDAPGPPEAVVTRVNELRREIARHDDLYFRLGKAEISDAEYDQLKAELQRLEARYPNEEYDVPAVNEIGDDRTGAFATRRHRVPMLSLDKAMSGEELVAYHERMVERLGRENVHYWVEPKYDGVAVSLTYADGKLVCAVTRGNGMEGDDITVNVRTIDSVPDCLPTVSADGVNRAAPSLIEIRGEIFLPFREFARINTEREEAGEPLYANPRNLAAGTAKLHDPDEVAERRLKLVCFGWGAFDPAENRPPTLEDFRTRLEAWGLPVVAGARAAIGLEEMRAAVAALEQSREDLPFPTDGAVVKLASTKERAQVGEADSAPRWAVARKFTPDRAATRLLDITLQVGRTGVITPVAELDPVWLDGSRISRASLHNADEIARRDLRIGDFVFVEKAGDIIPAVVGVDLARRPDDSEPYRFPLACPECHTPLERMKEGGAYRCVNDRCRALVARRIEHFASALQIRDLGPATAAALVEHAEVRTPADLYRLQEEELMAVPGIGARSAENLLSAIDRSRGSAWARVIQGLSILKVGTKRADSLAQAFPDFEALAKANVAQLTASEPEGGAGFGPATAEVIVTQLEEPATRELMRDLDEVGIQGMVTEEVQSEAFAGEVVVVTGALEGWTRSEILTRLGAAGARTTSDVSGATTLLVVGKRPGSKLKRAEELGVTVIDEAELVRRLGENERE